MISKNIYLFDVDGTLTPARQKMSDDFYSFFTKWMKDKKIYFVSGSDYKKIQQQVPENILLSVDGVFGCMGNTLHQNGEKIFENDFIQFIIVARYTLLLFCFFIRRILLSFSRSTS